MPRGSISSLTVTLAPEEHATLKALRRQTTLHAGVARRVQCVLLRAGGMTITALANHVGFSRKAAYKWLRRYQCEGLQELAGRSRTSGRRR